MRKMKRQWDDTAYKIIEMQMDYIAEQIELTEDGEDVRDLLNVLKGLKYAHDVMDRAAKEVEE